MIHGFLHFKDEETDTIQRQSDPRTELEVFLSSLPLGTDAKSRRNFFSSLLPLTYLLITWGIGRPAILSVLFDSYFQVLRNICHVCVLCGVYLFNKLWFECKRPPYPYMSAQLVPSEWCCLWKVMEHLESRIWLEEVCNMGRVLHCHSLVLVCALLLVPLNVI